MRLKRLLGLALAIGLGMGASAASANTINVSAPTVTGSGPYTWSYTTKLDGTGAIHQVPVAGEPDYFQIDAVAGFTGFTSATFTGAMGSVWTAAANPIGGGLVDLVFTYTGGASADMFNTIDPLVTVSFTDIYGRKARGFWESRDHSESAAGGTVDGYEALVNGQRTFVPAVPLPAAAWGGMGLLGLLAAARIRRRMTA